VRERRPAFGEEADDEAVFGDDVVNNDEENDDAGEKDGDDDDELARVLGIETDNEASGEGFFDDPKVETRTDENEISGGEWEGVNVKDGEVEADGGRDAVFVDAGVVEAGTVVVVVVVVVDNDEDAVEVVVVDDDNEEGNDDDNKEEAEEQDNIDDERRFGGR